MKKYFKISSAIFCSLCLSLAANKQEEYVKSKTIFLAQAGKKQESFLLLFASFEKMKAFIFQLDIDDEFNEQKSLILDAAYDAMKRMMQQTKWSINHAWYNVFDIKNFSPRNTMFISDQILPMMSLLVDYRSWIEFYDHPIHGPNIEKRLRSHAANWREVLLKVTLIMDARNVIKSAETGCEMSTVLSEQCVIANLNAIYNGIIKKLPASQLLEFLRAVQSNTPASTANLDILWQHIASNVDTRMLQAFTTNSSATLENHDLMMSANKFVALRIKGVAECSKMQLFIDYHVTKIAAEYKAKSDKIVAQASAQQARMAATAELKKKQSTCCSLQ